jgi:hypothetical protein
VPRKAAQVSTALTNKGFRKKPKGDHAFFVYYSAAEKKSAVFTKISHGEREITDSLLGKMAKQCRLSRADFDQLIECPLTREAYEKILATQKLVESA